MEALDRYVSYLLEWNSKVNLISRKDEDKIWKHHILHSVSLLLKVHLPMPSNIIDIGTGGGFPGIPLSILLPTCEFTLLDSIQKKIEAVGSMVKQLGLSNVNVVCGRAEQVARDNQYQSKFDFAVTRSVAPLGDLLKWSKGFFKKVNTADIKINPEEWQKKLLEPIPPALLAFKGGDLREEVEKVNRFKVVRSVHTLKLAVDGYPELEASEKKIVILELTP
ncbi:MAG: 16S rRNA (guanine(527)-N(7))-methyltransferase RsmG [bacterium]